jgi:hypothetical protein
LALEYGDRLAVSRESVSPSALRRVAWIALAIVGCALVVVAGIFYLTGGRTFVIQTPSMGEYAPVGTLVLSSVAGLTSLRVGQTILFRPPGASEVFFHRIVSISRGAIRTKGDLNGAIDPWTLHAHDLVGTEFGRLVGIGWLVHALPILLVGGLILQVVTHYYVIRYWQFPVRVLGWSVLVSLAAFMLKPFVRAVLLSQNVVSGTATSRIVPTGLFDVNAHAVRGSTAVLRPGQAGEVITGHASSAGFFEIDLTPSLGFDTWLLLIVLWLIPVILCIIYAIRCPEPDRV